MDHPPSSSNENRRPVTDPVLKNLILNKPRSAVSKLRAIATNPDARSERIAFLSHLVDAFSPRHWNELSTMCWNSLLEARLPQLIIEIFCEELKNTKSGKTHIHLACTISAASQYFKMAMIRYCQTCLSIFIDRAQSIVEAIWPYRRDLEADAITWTPLGQFFSLLGRKIARSHGISRIFDPEKPLGVMVFNAWLFANPDPTIEQTTSLMLHLASPTDLVRFVQKFVIEDGKLFELRRKLRDALKTVINERLEWLFGIAMKLTGSGNLTLKLEMIAERADVRLVFACNRQLDHGHREFDANIFHYAINWIYELLYRLDPERDPRMDAIIRNNIFRFLARASILSARLADEHHEFVTVVNLKKILETHIRHGEVLHEFNSMDQEDSYKDVYNRFSHYLGCVVRNLRALPKTRITKMLLEAWLNIASALGVDEPEEDKEEGVDSSVCSWKECHGLDRLDRMKQCSRCKLTKYCGSNCQNRDWIEGHKGKCGQQR